MDSSKKWLPTAAQTVGTGTDYLLFDYGVGWRGSRHPLYERSCPVTLNWYGQAMVDTLVLIFEGARSHTATIKTLGRQDARLLKVIRHKRMENVPAYHELSQLPRNIKVFRGCGMKI